MRKFYWTVTFRDGMETWHIVWIGPKAVPVHAIRAYRKSGSIVPLILYHGRWWRWVVSHMPWIPYPQGTKPLVPIQLGSWAVRRAKSGCSVEEKNLFPIPGFIPWIIQPVAQLVYQLCHFMDKEQLYPIMARLISGSHHARARNSDPCNVQLRILFKFINVSYKF